MGVQRRIIKRKKIKIKIINYLNDNTSLHINPPPSSPPFLAQTSVPFPISLFLISLLRLWPKTTRRRREGSQARTTTTLHRLRCSTRRSSASGLFTGPSLPSSSPLFSFSMSPSWLWLATVARPILTNPAPTLATALESSASLGPLAAWSSSLSTAPPAFQVSVSTV